MKELALPSFFLSLLALGSVFAAPPDEHPSEASRVFATYTPQAAEGAVVHARAFMDSLDDELGAACQLDLEHPERRVWTNVPSSADDGGARLGDLNEEQLQRLSDLLASVLSPQGYAKVKNIMLADDRLLRDGRPRVGFGTAEFRIVLFDEPSNESRWALQLDGHHLGLNLTFEGGRTTMSPSFIGTQPSAYERDGEEIVPMRGEVDDAFELINALGEEQRKQAVVSARRGRIVSGPGRDGVVPEAVGVSCAGFDKEQRLILRRLLRQFVGDLPASDATARMEALKLDMDKLVFAWSGPTDNPSDVSYRIQGPSVIIEYACQDLGGNPLDHLHSMYRDPKNEYGAGF